MPLRGRRGTAAFPADQTALLYPTGGYHWPGMGSDIDTSPWRDTFDQVERALQPFEIEPVRSGG